MTTQNSEYPVTYNVKYTGTSNRKTAFFRLLLSIPVVAVLMMLSGSTSNEVTNEAGKQMTTSGSSLAGGVMVATALLIIFRQKYPKWWYDFSLELNRFAARVAAYVLLLTDKYPSTTDAQDVTLEIPYPNVKKDLDRWKPLYKWLLAIPHYIVLIVLFVGVFFATVLAWLFILFTGQYPRPLFDYVTSVGRYSFRVKAYAFILTTDQYPPFALS